MAVRLDDTIAAVSTPVGEGGIGIVRLSGKQSLQIADRIFLSKDGKKPSKFKTYTIHYGHIIDNKSRTTNDERRIIDEVILTVMRQPRSYTKEDVVEINCHSGIIPLKKILDLALINGARLAEPGEFTKRAFLNGRIDILQAEAVLDIIRAKTDLSLRLALNNLGGLFSKRINEIRDRLLKVYAYIEASIDFSEEELDGLKKGDTFNILNKVKCEIERLMSGSSQGRILRQGIKTVICGSPNAGKSSLMNAILKESRSIVTHIPGTTRDTIEEIVNIKGIPVTLVDTAGITDTTHPIDREGVKRSHIYLENADLVLLVLDSSRRLNKDDMSIIKNIIANKKETIIVINKIDLKKSFDTKRIKRFFPKQPIVYISALNMTGITELENKVKDRVWKGRVRSADFMAVSNERHLETLRHCVSDIKEAINSYRRKMPLDCVNMYVRSAIEGLGQITGHAITENCLERIFSEFCIGK
jgi:tRNA modification GTPase